MIARRVQLAGVALTAMVAAGACSAPTVEGPRPSDTSPDRLISPGWKRVDVPGEIRAMDGTYTARLGVAGVLDDGGPLAAAVKGDRVNHVASRVPDMLLNGLHDVSGDYENDGLVEQLDPNIGVAARVHLGWMGDDKWNDDPEAPALPELEEWYSSTLVDRQGREAVWASLLHDDEGDVRAVGVVPEGDRWRVRAWEHNGDDWVNTDRGSGLFLAGEPTPNHPLATTEEVLVSVAGVMGRRAAGAEPSVWRLASDFSGNHPWSRVQLEGGADAITDLHAWAVGSWVAGVDDGRAVVWDLGPNEATRMDLPDVDLDPEHPVVKIVHGPVAWPLTIAVQSPDGPTLWIRDRDRWQEVVAPPGRLALAEGTPHGAYLLIDDRLWLWAMPWEEWRQD